MRWCLFLASIVLFVCFPFLKNSSAQDTPQWHLPEGVKARIGKGRANDIALSPDGSQLAVATGIGIWLYNARTGAEIALLTGHTDRVTSVTYSPKGKLLASASSREISLWNLHTQEHKATFEDKGGNSLVWSPYDQWLAVGRWGEVCLLNAYTGEEQFTFFGYTAGVSHLAFSPDSQTLAAAVDYGTMHLWNVRTGAAQNFKGIEGHTDSISALAFSPIRNEFVSAAWDSTLRLWNARTGQNIKTLNNLWIGCAAYSPNGSTLAVGRGPEILLLNANTLELQQTISGHIDGIHSLVFSSDGSTLASASSDGTISLWNAETGSHRLTIEGHFNFYSAALSPDGKTLATSSPDGIFLYNTRNGQFNTSFSEGGGSPALTYSPSGETLAAGMWDNGPEIRLLNAHTGEVKKTLRWKGRPATSLVFSPENAQMLAVGSWEGRIRLWNTQTGTLQRTLPTQTQKITSMVFSSDSKVLTSASWVGKILLWNTQTGKLQRTLPTQRQDLRSITLSPDGNTLASASWDTIRLWDAKNGQLKQTLDGDGASVAFSPTGKILAVGGWQKIDFWNAENGHLQRRISEIRGGALWLAFSPNADTLVSFGWEGTILLWDMNALPEIRAEDVNLDGVVDVQDLITVAASFGESLDEGVYPNPDVTGDGVVNRQDILKVLTLLEAAAGAPKVPSQPLSTFTADTLRYYIDRAKQFDRTDEDFQRGLQVLQELLGTLLTTQAKATPTETRLFANYPNPFNPETWIPYQLAENNEVSITIYDALGVVVRQLAIGHQPAGAYHSRSRAAYWDGRNMHGEPVASGFYFYTLSAGDFIATRKMLIRK